jgi:4-hydroxythreonine-4-phosphate dehydrogenase
MTLPRLLLTTGEPAGVGPDLCVRLALMPHAAVVVALGDPELLAQRARDLGIVVRIEALDERATPPAHMPGTLRVIPIASQGATPGTLDPRNAPYVIAMLERASDLCLAGAYDGIVTAPVHKGVINDGGIPFTGHTEFFAERARADVVMLLVAGTLRVALATTHLPLRAVPDAITSESLTKTIAIIDGGLRRAFGIAKPRIGVLGLNPHAGEGGHLGREEIDTIAPTLDALRTLGINLHGPLAGDTAFVPAQRERHDAYLAMYHDQGLAALKALGFGDAVNVTLGLPYVRTSVDHGTALDLAGTDGADLSSLRAATALAISLCLKHRDGVAAP